MMNAVAASMRIDAFREDVRIEGRATYTPFVRRRQFAAAAATTRGRADIGLRYTDAPPSVLPAAAHAAGRATHTLSLNSVEDTTAEVEQLLRTTYGQAG